MDLKNYVYTKKKEDDVSGPPSFDWEEVLIATCHNQKRLHLFLGPESKLVPILGTCGQPIRIRNVVVSEHFRKGLHMRNVLLLVLLALPKGYPYSPKKIVHPLSASAATNHSSCIILFFKNNYFFLT